MKKLYKLVSADIAQLFQATGTGRKRGADFAAAVVRGIPSALVIERQFDAALHDATMSGMRLWIFSI